MNNRLSPYDTGDRLQPRLWVEDGSALVAGLLPRPAQFSDYGRVDFDDDEGNTVFTAYIHKTDEGFIMRVEEFQDAPLTIETSSDRAVRQDATHALHAGLNLISESLSEHLQYEDDGDPSAFAHGHFSFSPTANDYPVFYVTERYAGTNEYEDDDAIPTSWEWKIEEEQHTADGGTRIIVADHGSASPSEIHVLLSRAQQWVDETELRIQSKDSTLVIETAQTLIVPTRPHNWEELGSSEKDLWEDRARSFQAHQPLPPSSSIGM